MQIFSIVLRWFFHRRMFFLSIEQILDIAEIFPLFSSNVFLFSFFFFYFLETQHFILKEFSVCVRMLFLLFAFECYFSFLRSNAISNVVYCISTVTRNIYSIFQYQS